MIKRFFKFIRPQLPKLLFFPMAITGIVIFVLLLRNRQGLERVPQQEVVRVLRVIPAPLCDIMPRAVGFGTAEPAEVWLAIAEVKGRVIEAHPELSAGSVVEKDAVLLKIEPTEYDLSIARLSAAIEQTQAQSEELTTKQSNDEASLKIERDSLSLAQRDLERMRKLKQVNAIAESEVDQQERNVLVQRQKTQTLTNAINLVPATRKAIEANIAVQQAQLAQAKLDREKTTIRSPFSGRVGPVAIEIGQFLAVGQTLFELHNVDSIEVESQVSLGAMRNLLTAPVSGEVQALDMDKMRQIFNFDAVVRFKLGDRRVEWPARFVRVRENLNAQTRTLGIVLVIDEPYARAIPGKRPPPMRGTFCEVELRSKQTVSHVIIPRAALHDGKVYVVNADDRLESRQVSVAFSQSGFVALHDGIEAGEKVVVSDPTPAVEGMLVDGIEDAALVLRLTEEAKGKGDVK